jgi:hypothetical protein
VLSTPCLRIVGSDHKSPGVRARCKIHHQIRRLNRVFLEGDKLEVAVKNGRRVLTHPSANPQPDAIFRTTETALQPS